MDHRERVYRSYREVTGVLARIDAEGPARRVPHHLHKIVRRHFPEDRGVRVLDLGCGRGDLLAVARAVGYGDLTGIDGSPSQVAAAQRRGVADVRQGDILDVLDSLEPGCFDVVVTYDVIEHFTMPELLRVVDGVARILRPGGRWIIHAPNGEGLFGMRMRYWDITHEMAFTRNSLGQLLVASGFAGVSCFEDQPIPHGVKSAVRFVLWRCIRFVLWLALAAETGETDRGAIFSQNLLAVAHKAPAGRAGEGKA